MALAREFATAELAPFAEYKKRVDPEGHFNRGKLLAGLAIVLLTAERAPQEVEGAEQRAPASLGR